MNLLFKHFPVLKEFYYSCEKFSFVEHVYIITSAISFSCKVILTQ